ncbi:MAG: transglycosylase SLT domain-containing protein [Pyrinomonadaceae bacterium]
MIIPHVHHKTKVSSLAFGIFATLLLSLSASAQTEQERHARLRSTLDSGDMKAASTELNSLRGSNPDLFAANNYDYLLGRIQERTSDSAGASTNYESVVARNSLLSQYALWHLAQIARSTGNLTLEREKLRQLLTVAPQSLLREAANLRLGQSFFESKDYNAAVSALRPLTELKNKLSSREALSLIGQALMNAGKGSEAREAFTRLIMQMPDAARPDDFALFAVRGLDAIDSGNAVTAPAKAKQLAESEHLLRASIYQFNRDFDAARLHYIAVVEYYPQSPALANALYQIGRGFYLQPRYDEALKYFQQVLERFPDSLSARDALSLTAGTYNRLKRTDDAVAAYKRFSERFPDAPNPERSYLNIIDALLEAGRYDEALDWVRQTRNRFKGQIGEPLALFAQTRIHLAQGSWSTVVSDTNELRKFSDLGGTRLPGGTTQSEVTFLRAYALELMGRIGEAITEYLSVPDGRNEYYGRRATQRLLTLGADAKTRPLTEARASSLRAEAEKAIANGQSDQGRRLAQDALRLIEDPAPKDELRELLLRTYEGLPAYQFPSLKIVPLGRQQVVTTNETQGGQEISHRALADELIFLGLYDEGIPEFAATKLELPVSKDQPPQKTAGAPVKQPANGTPAASSQINLDYTLAVYSARGGLANRAVRFGEQLWKAIPQDYVLELAPRDLVDLLYPLPYREPLLKHAPARAVDPRFVVSIARQESRFQPDAKSVAAARGLMQFIPATAKDIAAQLELKDFAQDSLYNPDTAILFGAQYLANLFKQFPAQPQAVAAAYNGGPENVARWIARARSNEADRYAPELGFSQTKDYVFKVMINFWVYQQLYDEKLERK